MVKDKKIIIMKTKKYKMSLFKKVFTTFLFYNFMNFYHLVVINTIIEYNTQMADIMLICTEWDFIIENGLIALNRCYINIFISFRRLL